MPPEDTRLSKEITVKKYNDLVRNENWDALSGFISSRFKERYFDPVNSMPPGQKNGFMMMAICCLVIETLESFHQGIRDTNRQSRQAFRDFFDREASFSGFRQNGDWFYEKIRCGILHQAETCDGWRILRKGPLLDHSKRTINATKFMEILHESVNAYAETLRKENSQIPRERFLKKMKAICENCEPKP